MSNDLVDAAKRYLDLGLSVIALTGKAPNGEVHKHGLHDALSYAHLVREAGNGATMGIIHPSYYAPFTHPETTGIGILTGSGRLVVDIDGEEGAVQWKGIVGDTDEEQYTWVAKTGRGLHLYFGDIVMDRRTRKLGPKLDLKASGGYVAAPPSRHPEGHYYEWITPPASAIALAPQLLLELLAAQDLQSERALLARATRKRVRHDVLEDGKIWASWGFEGVYKKMREGGEGNRNSLLYWSAYTLAEDGATDEDFDELGQAALDAGLTRREVRLTMRSAVKAADG